MSNIKFQSKGRKKYGLLEYLSYISVLLFLLYMFSYPDSIIMMYISTVLIITVLTIRLASKGKVNTYFYWGWLFIIICLVSLFWSPYVFTTLSEIIKIIQIILVGTVISSWVDDESKIESIFNMIILSSIIMSVRILFEVPIHLWGNRFSWIFGINVNPISMKLAISALLSTYLLIKSENKKKVLYILCIFLLVIIILLLGSRRALLIWVLCTLLLIVLSFRKTIKPLIISGSLIIIVYNMIFKIDVFYNIIGSRIISYNNLSTSSSGDNIRQQLIRLGIDLFKERPILGWGVNNFRYLSGLNMYSHNNYIELLVSLGIVGFLVFYMLHVIIISRIDFRNKNDYIFFVIIIAVISSDFVAPSFSVMYIHFFLSIIVGYQENIKINQISCNQAYMNTSEVLKC